MPQNIQSPPSVDHFKYFKSTRNILRTPKRGPSHKIVSKYIVNVCLIQKSSYFSAYRD